MQVFNKCYLHSEDLNEVAVSEKIITLYSSSTFARNKLRR
jgi:hypothetical protein